MKVELTGTSRRAPMAQRERILSQMNFEMDQFYPEEAVQVILSLKSRCG